MNPARYPVVYIDRAVAGLARTEEILARVQSGRRELVSGEVHPGGGLLLTLNRGRFVKPCPCRTTEVCCGLWIVEWGLGCPFACDYCVIRQYQPTGDLTLFLNWEDALREVVDLRQRGSGFLRLGTGEFGDSLAVEAFFPFQRWLWERVRDLPDLHLELKTKSAAVEGFLGVPASRRLVFSFSLNPDRYVATFDKGAASLQARLAAARRMAEAGFGIGFHLEPMMPLPDWREAYEGLVADMVQALGGKDSPSDSPATNRSVDENPGGLPAGGSWPSPMGSGMTAPSGDAHGPSLRQRSASSAQPAIPGARRESASMGSVRWVSLGTFRLPPTAREALPQDSPLFSEEMAPAFDGKLRYFRPLREEMYRFVRERLTAVWPAVPVYLCMESSSVWERVTGWEWTAVELARHLEGKG